MRNICNEEKNLKKYLKNQVSLNLQTMVKFLITGMIGFSLTACGGGGGGGSSSSPKPPITNPEPDEPNPEPDEPNPEPDEPNPEPPNPEPPKPEPPKPEPPKPEPPKPEPPLVEEVNKKNETHEVKDSNSIITGKIEGDIDEFTGLKAENSTVENKAEISSTGDKSIGIHGTSDDGSSEHIITNSGTITMSGHESVGILVENGVTGINRGDIILNSTESDELITTEEIKEIDDEMYLLEHTRKRMDTLVGMLARNKSTILNEKNIKLTGKGIGMVASNESKAINSANISVESKGQECEVVKSALDSNYVIKEVSWKETHFSEIMGMLASEKSEIINETKEGVINLNGEGAGMVAIEGSSANNKGKIFGASKIKEIMGKNKEVSSFESSKIIGMLALEKSTATNNGLISLKGSSAYGMVAEGDSTITNNSEIVIDLIDGIAGKYNLSEVKAEGMSLKNSSGENNGLITINGTQSNSDDSYSVGVSIDGGEFANNQNGEIEIEVLGDGVNVIGIEAENATSIVNSGEIKVVGQNSKGIKAKNVISIINNKDIDIKGKYVDGIRVINDNLENDSKVENNKLIKVVGDKEGKYITGITAEGVNSIINNGEINITKISADSDNENEITGIFAQGKSIDNNSVKDAEYKKIEIKNNGSINVVGSDSKMTFGIEAENAEIENKGTIDIKGENVVIGISSENSNVSNSGVISVNVNSSNSETTFALEESTIIGIEASGGKITNDKKGTIIVQADNSIGISAINSVVNRGTIDVKGEDSIGIKISGAASSGTNYGIINIDGKGSYGMYAENGATITNGVELGDKEAQKNSGVINVKASAAGAMYAINGSKAVNYGTINIETGNTNADKMVTDNLGNKISSAAMKTDGGTIENYGTINTNVDLTINSINGGAYVIGTSEDGSYGKISAKNVSIDGDVVVSSDITKSGFKNEYTMQNVVDAEAITLGDDFYFVSDSLLYDAEAITDTWGNLDATLTRNNKNLSNFTTGYITSTANIFEKYQNENSFDNLSTDAKEVIKAIDTTSVESINETLNGLTPTIYANLGRQILETNETFKKQDMMAINSLGENNYNFTFIGEYQDVDSRNNIEGYKSKMSGFVGAMNFGDSTFGTIGYGYNDIDYKDNGKGHIQSIHLGLNKLGKYEDVNYNFGIGGEYNFHENKRDIELLGRKADSDFDSYGIRASGEISKMFGEKAYVKPYLGLDLAHMKYDSFTESNANSLNADVESENYTSVLPKVGFLFGDRFYGLNLFAGVEYSYELGNVDKEQNFSYEGFEGTGKLPKDSLECGTTGIKAGASYEMNNFTLGASIGKNFGKRDNSLVDMSLGYKF